MGNHEVAGENPQNAGFLVDSEEKLSRFTACVDCDLLW